MYNWLIQLFGEPLGKCSPLLIQLSLDMRPSGVLTKCKVAVRLADKEEKGDSVRTSKREEKEQYRHASDHEQAGLSLRVSWTSHGSCGTRFHPRPSLEGRPPLYERREIVNAILYVLRSGCPWRLLPHDLPTWGTAYWYFRRWRDGGVWDQVLKELRMEVRIK